MTFTDARRGSKVADLCDDCAGEMPGRAAAAAAAGRSAAEVRRHAGSAGFAGAVAERRLHPRSRLRGDAPRTAARPGGVGCSASTATPRSRRSRRSAAAVSAPKSASSAVFRPASGSVGSQVYDGPMGLVPQKPGYGLSLLAGPANAGKVALLLERYLARLDDEPFLIVPNRSDVDRVERDLLRRCGCLLGGSIGTFDDLFARIAAGDPRARPVATDAQRTLVARRAVAEVVRARHDARSPRSARFAGFADALLGARRPSSSRACSTRPTSTATLAELYAAYRAELDRVGLWDRDLLRRRASERLQSELDAWHGEPVFAYGFEDLTAAEWSLLEALAGRAEVDVSLPVRAGPRGVRVAPAHGRGSRRARRTGARAELAAALVRVRRAGARAGSSGRCSRRRAPTRRRSPAPSRSSRAPARAARSSSSADEVLELLRDGMPAEQIALVVADRSIAGARRSRRCSRRPASRTRSRAGRGCRRRRSATRCSRCSASPGPAPGARELYAFLRSPYSGIARSSVDFAEGRLRGRAVEAPELRRGRDRAAARGAARRRCASCATPPIAGRGRARAARRRWSRSAYGLDGAAGRRHRRGSTCAASPRPRALLDELDDWERRRRAARRPPT